MRTSTIISLAWFIALAILVVPAGAHAYLDPGTGSVIVQAVVAGVVAVGFFVKTQWHRLTTFVGSLFGKKTASRDASKKK